MRHEQAADQTLAHLKHEAASWRRVRDRAVNASNAMKQREEFNWQFQELLKTEDEAKANAQTLEAAIRLLETS